MNDEKTSAGTDLHPPVKVQGMSEFADLSTAEISDALDVLRLPGGALGICPVRDGLRLIARAFTVRYVPTDVIPGTVGDYVDDVPPGCVVVLDNAGRMDCTVWGNILTEVASSRGVAGTVINGVCRDVAASRQFNYPLFSRGCFMRTGKDRVQVEEVGGPVSLGDVRVRSGDLLVGDDDGIVVVPVGCEAEVLEIALRTREAEDRIVTAVRSGTKLDEARRRHGYHQLQRARGA
jgi:4-hydroxy-4-methyl-2-oxoglutarate aldolase